MNKELKERIESLEAERLRPVPPVPVSEFKVSSKEIASLVDIVAGYKPNWGHPRKPSDG